jgi:Amino acid synthesis
LPDGHQLNAKHEGVRSMMEIRKVVVLLEETHREMERAIPEPTRKVTVAAVIKNPYANKYVEDLSEMYDLGAAVSEILARRGVQALGCEPHEVESYGKGAIVGVDGEIEHTAALLHPKFGAPVRREVGEGKDIIPGTKKVGGPGASIVLPLTNKNNVWDFDRMDSTEISIPDAPRADEIVIALALGIGGRPLHRTKLPK